MTENTTISELARGLGENTITAEDIAVSFIERIGLHDGAIHSYIFMDPDRLMGEARAADRRRREGNSLSPYDGIPVAVKDNILTAGVATTCASRILENFVSPINATVMEKLAEKGFILLGKTNCDEFAMGSSTENSCFGPTRNPYDEERVPGGSSGGSAAAVAARMAPASLGSDTGGSIRQPAAFCGVAGIKPTYGRVSRYGLVAYASSLDQIGTFGSTVDDAALLLSVIAGRDRRDSTSVEATVDFAPSDLSADVRGLRLGIPDEYFQGVSPEIVACIKKEIDRLAARGAEVVPISLRYTEYAIPVYYLIATAEASSNLSRFDGVRYGRRSEAISDLSDLYVRSRSEGFGKEVKRRIILGTFSLSSGYYDAYYLKALKGRSLIIDDFRRAFESVDAIIAPVTTTTAFRLGELIDDPLQMYMSDILTISANLAGIPALNVPAGLDGSGLPIGLQVMGNHFMEKIILRVAKAVEEDCGTFSPSL